MSITFYFYAKTNRFIQISKFAWGWFKTYIFMKGVSEKTIVPHIKFVRSTYFYNFHLRVEIIKHIENHSYVLFYWYRYPAIKVLLLYTNRYELKNFSTHKMVSWNIIIVMTMHSCFYNMTTIHEITYFIFHS